MLSEEIQTGNNQDDNEGKKRKEKSIKLLTHFTITGTGKIYERILNLKLRHHIEAVGWLRYRL